MLAENIRNYFLVNGVDRIKVGDFQNVDYGGRVVASFHHVQPNKSTYVIREETPMSIPLVLRDRGEKLGIELVLISSKSTMHKFLVATLEDVDRYAVPGVLRTGYETQLFLPIRYWKAAQPFTKVGKVTKEEIVAHIWDPTWRGKELGNFRRVA